MTERHRLPHLRDGRNVADRTIIASRSARWRGTRMDVHHPPYLSSSASARERAPVRNTLRMQRIVQMRAAIIEGGGKHRDAIRRNRGNGTTLNAQGSHLLTISIVGRFGGGLTSCWPGQSYTRHLASTKKGR